MIRAPQESKRRAAVRVVAEALSQATPITAGLAHLYRFTHPTEMERAIEAWRSEVGHPPAARGCDHAPLAHQRDRPRDRPLADRDLAGRIAHPAQPQDNRVELKPAQDKWTKVCGKDEQAGKEICYTTRDFGTDPNADAVELARLMLEDASLGSIRDCMREWVGRGAGSILRLRASCP